MFDKSNLLLIKFQEFATRMRKRIFLHWNFLSFSQKNMRDFIEGKMGEKSGISLKNCHFAVNFRENDELCHKMGLGRVLGLPN